MLVVQVTPDEQVYKKAKNNCKYDLLNYGEMELRQKVLG